MGFVGLGVSNRSLMDRRAITRRDPRGCRVVVPKMALEFVGQEDQVEKAAKKAFRDFLTRRAVRTVLYYLREFHDGSTEKWLKKFEDFDREERHFSDWEGYIMRMFEAKRVEGVEVQAHPKGNFRREFKFTIEPARVARRVLATRLHIASEWKEDLRLLDRENLEINRFHFELSVNPDVNLDPLKERILDVDLDDDSSPLRSQSYARIRTLATHYATHRLLQRMKAKSNHHYMWLSEYLIGHSIGPDSEQFLYNLLCENPLYRTNPKTYISPPKVAMMIMNCRIAVAEEWITDLDSVEEDQLALQRTVLQRRSNNLFF